jgi:hypothetical protein
MGLRAGLDNVENRKFYTLRVLELRILCRPARSHSLYQLRYLGSFWKQEKWKVTRNIT